MSEDNSNIQLQRILEGAILAAGEPLSADRLRDLFGEEDGPDLNTIKEALVNIQQSCSERGFELVEVASGWRFQVRQNLAPWVNKLWEEKPQKYSRALLETLALIAYRQPITRGDIEEVRGVSVSSHIIKTLVEREWVKVVGHRDVPGRPALYATTRKFLDYFNLKSLDELPTLGELKDIDSLSATFDFDSVDESSAAEGPEEGNSQEGVSEEGVSEEGDSEEGISEDDLSEEDTSQASIPVESDADAEYSEEAALEQEEQALDADPDHD